MKVVDMEKQKSSQSKNLKNVIYARRLNVIDEATIDFDEGYEFKSIPNARGKTTIATAMLILYTSDSSLIKSVEDIDEKKCEFYVELGGKRYGFSTEGGKFRKIERFDPLEGYGDLSKFLVFTEASELYKAIFDPAINRIMISNKPSIGFTVKNSYNFNIGHGFYLLAMIAKRIKDLGEEIEKLSKSIGIANVQEKENMIKKKSELEAEKSRLEAEKESIKRRIGEIEEKIATQNIMSDLEREIYDLIESDRQSEERVKMLRNELKKYEEWFRQKKNYVREFLGANIDLDEALKPFAQNKIYEVNDKLRELDDEIGRRESKLKKVDNVRKRIDEVENNLTDFSSIIKEINNMDEFSETLFIFESEMNVRVGDIVLGLARLAGDLRVKAEEVIRTLRDGDKGSSGLAAMELDELKRERQRYETIKSELASILNDIDYYISRKRNLEAQIKSEVSELEENARRLEEIQNKYNVDPKKVYEDVVKRIENLQREKDNLERRRKEIDQRIMAIESEIDRIENSIKAIEEAIKSNVNKASEIERMAGERERLLSVFNEFYKDISSKIAGLYRSLKNSMELHADIAVSSPEDVIENGYMEIYPLIEGTEIPIARLSGAEKIAMGITAMFAMIYMSIKSKELYEKLKEIGVRTDHRELPDIPIVVIDITHNLTEENKKRIREVLRNAYNNMLKNKVSNLLVMSA